MKQLKVIVIGAGNRGERYALHMCEMPQQYQIVGVADPDPARQRYFMDHYGVPAEGCFDSWEAILAQPKFADVAVIATVDDMHYEPALRAIDMGYDLLLEKPVAPNPQQCADIARAAKEKGVTVLVCHVLRYTPFYGKIKELLMNGAVGDIVSVDLVEGVGNVHFSHSFVRGNWHNTAFSAPMLLAKSCHDLDIVQWLLDKPCQSVSSFGSLTHFLPENAPEGAPERCDSGKCPVGDTCPYNCIRHYHDEKQNVRREIITKGIAKEHGKATDAEVMEALHTTDYGRCVYHANNNMVDHQVVSMEFAGGITAVLTLNAFNKGGRYIRIYGTKGELYAHMKDTQIQVYDFETKQTTFVPVLKTEESINGGHGGGDSGIVREMYDYFCGCYTGYKAADIHISVQNHMIGYAAEEARVNRTVVDVQEYVKRF